MKALAQKLFSEGLLVLVLGGCSGGWVAGTAALAAETRGAKKVVGAEESQGRVVWVHDGDTVFVRVGSTKEKVRLIGIDTDELDDSRAPWREMGYRARDYARSRLEDRRVTLRSDPRCADRDDYGRLLRYVILDDGTNFNEEMVRRGYARAFTRFPFVLSKEFVAVEKEARRAGIGRWAPHAPGSSRLGESGQGAAKR